MLEMDEGRISFAEALRPPLGYRVAFVVGTTYTLDLRALLGVCIPLGLGFEPEELNKVNLVSLFAALQELRGKMVVYCDKGHINADIQGDARARGLAILLEDMIHQVHVNRWHPQRKRRFDGLSSFHPKVWVVEYKPNDPKEPPKYRLLVMSRNLTFDTSWDAAVSIDGRPGKPNECAAHVANFLEFLALGDSLISTEKDNRNKRGSHSSRVLRLAKAIRSVEFEVTGGDFDSVDFLPFGPRGKTGNAKLLDPYACSLATNHYRNLLVASPFLSDAKDSPLRLFADNRSGRSGRFMLLSREDSLAKLGAGVRSSYECYAPVSWLSDVELEAPQGDAPDASNYSNLHAKLYFAEEPSSKRHLYLGSLNASRNGMVNNVEALLHLGVKRSHLTFASVARVFVGDEKKRGAFEPFVSSLGVLEPDEDGLRFRRLFQASTKLLEFKSVVAAVDDDSYRIDVELALNQGLQEAERISYTLQPLLATLPASLDLGTKGGTVSLSYAPVKLQQISALFVLQGRDADGREESSILACPRDCFDDSVATVEARSSALLKSIIAAHESALPLYIAHAFGMVEPEQRSGGEHASSGGQAMRSESIAPALYERLLERAYYDPGAIRRAEYLLEMLPSGVADEQVKKLKVMVATFQRAVR